MKNKILSVIASLSVAINLLATPVLAETNDLSNALVQIHEDGNWIAMGGINEYKSIEMQSREETNALETTLIADDYILINTDNMQISEEDYNTFMSKGTEFWFSQYMYDERNYWTSYKVYAFRPSFEDYVNQIKETGTPMSYTCQEIINSTVLLDYHGWDSLDAVGTINTKINHDFEEWENTGFLEIHSPIDCEIKFLHADTRTYYVLYVRKDKPLLVCVMRGILRCVGINTQEIQDGINNSGEDALPYNNVISLNHTNTIDNPFILDLNDVVNKYSISDMDISDKPDCSYYPIEEDTSAEIPSGETISQIIVTEEIPEEQTIIQDDETETKDGSNTFKIILWSAVAILIVIAVIYAIRTFKKPISQNDTDYDDNNEKRE